MLGNNVDNASVCLFIGNRCASVVNTVICCLLRVFTMLCVVVHSCQVAEHFHGESLCICFY